MKKFSTAYVRFVKFEIINRRPNNIYRELTPKSYKTQLKILKSVILGYTNRALNDPALVGESGYTEMQCPRPGPRSQGKGSRNEVGLEPRRTH